MNYDYFYSISTNLIAQYGDVYADVIGTSLLNVILVVTGARKACIIDAIRNNDALLQELLDTIIIHYPTLTTIMITSVEHLVCLSTNEEHVKNILIKNDPLKIASLLGYCYINTDFANTKIQRIAVDFRAKSMRHGIDTHLYYTVMPSSAYNTTNVQTCIKNIIKTYNEVLIHLEYEVVIKKKLI